MNPIAYGFTRCARHPSEFFTGFCSSCLHERLSAIDAAGRHSELLDLPSSDQDLRRNSHAFGERRTLRSLFRDDDEVDDPMESEPKSLPQGSSTEESGHGGASSKPRNISFWLGSVLSKNLQKWRINGSSQMKNSSLRNKNAEEFGRIDQKPRYSCDWRPSWDSTKVSWEDPRHSWDGAMASRAFAEEADGRDSYSSWPSERKGFQAMSSQLDSSTRTTDSSSSPFPSQNKKSLRQNLNQDHPPHHHHDHHHDRAMEKKLPAIRNKEQRFRRSRSSHFFSPGNLDNGLLRFYLTPLRSSRRNAKNRMNKGIFGFYRS